MPKQIQKKMFFTLYYLIANSIKIAINEQLYSLHDTMSELRDNVLHAVDIVDLVGKYVTIKKTWKNRIGLCPFHKEHTPSFTVAEDKQIFKCFGCGKGGNAITFLMEIERIDFWDALTNLAKEHHIEIPTYSPQQKELQHIANTTREKIKRINILLQDFLVTSLTKAEHVQHYIKTKRWLSDPTIHAFGLWYAPDSNFTYIQMLKEHWFTADDLIQAWVAKQHWTEVSTFFKERLTFPIYDHMGTIVWFWARALHPDQQPKYLNSTETPLYDKSKILYGMNTAKQMIKDHGYILIVEWYMDVIASAQYWLPVAVATCGTALTQHHAKAIKRQAETVIFAFDNDWAWREATSRGLKVAFSVDLFPRMLTIPSQYKDIDEYLTARAWAITTQEILAMSKDAFSWVIEFTLQRLDSRNPIQRKQITTYLFDILIYIQDYSVLLLYIENMATALGITQDALIPEFKRHHIQAMRQWMRPIDTTYTSTTNSETLKNKAPSDGQLTQELLLYALMYEDFCNTLTPQHIAQMQQRKELIKAAWSYIPNYDNINDIEHAVKEWQLWREHNIDNLNSQKAYHHISRFVKSYIQKSLQESIKNKLLTTEQKQAILVLLQRLNQAS
jgi:DNA primase